MSSGMDAVNAAMVSGGMLGPNQYSRFQGRIPQPGYNGTPTDAQGKPITAPQGLTLNTPPPAAAPPQGNTGWNQNPVGSPLNPMGDWTQLAPQNPYATTPQAQADYARNLGLGGFTDPSTGHAYVGGASQQPAAAASSGPAPSSLDNAIQMLSNPGHVTTPGADVQPASPTASQPDVLSQFLNSHGSGGTGAGGYSNKGFFDTLNALRSGQAPPPSAPSSAPPSPTPGLSLMTPAPAGAPPPVDPNASVIHLGAPKPPPRTAPISPLAMPAGMGGLMSLGGQLPSGWGAGTNVPAGYTRDPNGTVKDVNGRPVQLPQFGGGGFSQGF